MPRSERTRPGAVALAVGEVGKGRAVSQAWTRAALPVSGGA